MELKTEHQKIDKLSQFVRAAVAECDALIEDPEYVLDSSQWHGSFDRNDEDGACMICLAGAMMAAAADTPEKTLSPQDFTGAGKLDALETIRRGHLNSAVLKFHGIMDGKIAEELEVEWSGASEWKARARAELLHRADILEKAGY